MGIERLMMVMDKQNIEMPAPDRCEIFIASLGEAAHLEAFKLADSCASIRSSRRAMRTTAASKRR